jgi:hypothetical protein
MTWQFYNPGAWLARTCPGTCIASRTRRNQTRLYPPSYPRDAVTQTGLMALDRSLFFGLSRGSQ